MRLILTVILLLILCSIFANPITQDQAKIAASNWTNVWAPQDFTNKTIQNVTPLAKDGVTVMYLVEYINGFVLLSADDACRPIIGYGYDTVVNGIDHNDSFAEFIENHKTEIQTIQSQKRDNSKTALQWQEVLNNQVSRDGTRSMRPLLNTTWDQGTPYNLLCPVAATGPGGHVWAGCVATAMTQVMKYWNWPVTGVGSHTYHPSGYPTQTANFAATTYNWSEMPDHVSQPNDAVETLLWHAGISVNMMYSPTGSGAYSQTAAQSLKQFFRYDTGLTLEDKDNYTAEEWDNLCRAQLDNALPMYYSGSGPGGGHAFVCDGYQNSNYFHFNWGWSGSYDGYYYLSNLNPGYTFNDGQSVIINMKPLNYNPSMAQISLSGSECEVGDIVPISINNYPLLSDWNITHISFLFQYDNADMSFVGVDASNTMVEGSDITAVETEPGIISCTINSTTPFIGGGTMVKLRFQTLGPGACDFMIGNFMLNNNVVTALQQTNINVTATVTEPQNSVIDLLNSMYIPLNNEAILPVNTTFIIPVWNVLNTNFIVHYPSEKVTWDSYDVTDCLLSNSDISVTNVSPGVLSFNVSTSPALFGSGTLLKLRFLATGNTNAASVATITISDFYYGSTAVQNLLPGYILLSPTTANNDPLVVPVNRFSISPNPFVGATKFALQLSKQNQKAVVNIYNIRGQLVKSFTGLDVKGNSLDLNWDGRDMKNHVTPSGMYLVKIMAGDYNKTSKLMKL